MIVVDASILVSWFLPEENSDKARKLLRYPQRLVAPELVEVEVSAAITKAARMGRIETDYARECFGKWLAALRNGVIATIPNIVDLEHALTLSFDVQHSLQDCLYLAAAHRLGAPIATTDAKQAEKAVLLKINVLELPVANSGIS